MQQKKSATRSKNAAIAADTLKRIATGYEEQTAASECIREDQVFRTDAASAGETRFVVSGQTTLTALYACPEDANVAVLNFASAKNIGGGFKKGSQAQEETLARSSSLYVCLEKFQKDFYNYNRKTATGIYSHRMIYSPRVTFFKDDAGHDVAPRTVAVITSPAVNAGVAKCSKEQVDQLMEERMRRILQLARERGHQFLILGAFGCGVFKNPAKNVAAIWQRLLHGEFANQFEFVHFACYGPKENREPFEKMFST